MKTLSYFLRNRSLQTIVVLVVYALLADDLSTRIHQQLYTISLLIKDILMLVMPITIGVFIASTVRSFENKAIIFVITIVMFEACSNFACVWYAFITAKIAVHSLASFNIHNVSNNFEALWRLPLIKPFWWSADKGACVGVVIGCFAAISGNPTLTLYVKRAHKIMEFILTKIFARLIPIFVLGFAAQMHQMKLLNHIFAHYANLLIWLMMFLIAYIFTLFAVGAGFSFMNILRHIKNLLPAGAVALTSGCSLSTMPWTIEGSAKNLHDKSLAQAVIPATTNIQQVGDCIVNSFLCFVIYNNFYDHNPEIYRWFVFSIAFVLARFVTAAMIGGAIFIMLPIYESYLGFTPDMIAIILGMNVVLDPIVTSCNVVANGALCRVFEMVWGWVQRLYKHRNKVR